MPGSIFPKRNKSGDSAPREIPAEALSLYQQASELSRQGKTEDALHRFRQAVEIAPDYTYALHEIGNCLYDLGRHEEANMYYSRALQEIGDRLYEIGRYEESLGRYWVAIGRYEEAGKYYNPRSSPDPFFNGAPAENIRDVKKAEPDNRKV
ncbi:MAG: tetratricopeptide repeat protein [Methanoregula sp.]|nr:tetratricopeptide repeat protein [Methanoregula sp.]